ncbi:hypothetical protein TIFTF001_001633 [Ficus carica]|uniref:Uncharacterized protein n=1 Tax=Ficus carica TaxID=3494 RepID=A0AA87ZHG8_FICCA|nr:hypothetical protein TIFTF001_001633 [Ficus carica]
MKNINLTTQYISFVLLLFISNLSPKQALVEKQKLAADCPRECGGVSIQYPFGIGSNCSLDDNFSVYCNTSFNLPKPFLESINLELKNISVLQSTVQVNSPVFSNCQDQGTTGSPLVDLSFTPYAFSGSDNVFTAVGCNNIALLTKDVDEEEIVGGCMSYCHGGVLNTSRGLHSCFVVDCCQTTIPWPHKVLNVSFQSTEVGGQDNLCHYALMVRKTWLAESDLEPNISLIDRLGLRYVPAVLDWAINIDDDYGSCSGIYLGINNGSGGSGDSICGSQAHCSNRSEGYVCVCNHGYAGNPYDTCVDRDECANGNPCEGGMICTNTPGGYNCSCRFGYTYDEGSCNPIPYEYIWILAMIGQGGGLMILLGCLWGLHRVYETRKDKRLKKKYFRLNGGLLLQERISSSEDTVKKIELFTSKELEKATDDYDRNRIVGRGGQGTVYKGMLTDGRVVAVKLSKPLEENQVKNFINVVIILSKINHRNVVKISGCCLESKLPMLVYEFIPNGTLFDYIQGKNEEIPFSWDVRFQIAIEIAVTLCYLYSHAEKPIFHRDIKSTNILLDERSEQK